MRITRILTISILILAFLWGCKKEKPSSINLEQKDNTYAKHILTPGLGTIGLIENDEIMVYYLSESHNWILDKVSQFQIPENNSGVLAMGMGILGIASNSTMNFYYVDSEDKWIKDEMVKFFLPDNFKKISSMRVPWSIGVIALEEKAGMLEFYFLNDHTQWELDETATFNLPIPLDDYLMLGNMEIGVITGNKLGVYRLDNEGEWTLLENLILSLPADTKAIFPFEPGTIAVLRENKTIQFFDMDHSEGRWIVDPSMNFYLP